MNWTADQLRVFPIAFIFIIAVSIALGFLLKNKQQKLKNLPFKVIAIILIVAEIIKQIRALDGSYSMWSLPLHYCSMFMFWFFLASFTKGKWRDIGHKVSFVMGIGFLLGFIYDATPIIGSSAGNLVWGWDNFGSLHTFYYHFTVILFLGLQVALKQVNISLKDFKLVTIPFFSWMIVATIFAHIFNTNYSNLLHNNIIAMDTIRIELGYPIYLASMYIFFFTILVSILAVGSLSNIFIDKIKNKKTAK